MQAKLQVELRVELQVERQVASHSGLDIVVIAGGHSDGKMLQVAERAAFK